MKSQKEIQKCSNCNALLNPYDRTNPDGWQCFFSFFLFFPLFSLFLFLFSFFSFFSSFFSLFFSLSKYLLFIQGVFCGNWNPGVHPNISSFVETYSLFGEEKNDLQYLKDNFSSQVFLSFRKQFAPNSFILKFFKEKRKS